MKSILAKLLRPALPGLLIATAQEGSAQIAGTSLPSSPTPILQVLREGPLLRLVWPGQPASGRDSQFIVEESTSLLPPIHWTPARESDSNSPGTYLFDPNLAANRFFRLVSVTPEIPTLTGLVAATNRVVLGGSMPITFQIPPGSPGVSEVEVTLVSRGSRSVVLFAPETLGLSPEATSATWLLHTEGLGFGLADLTLRIRDTQGRFSESRSLQFEVLPESDSGSPPVLRSVDPVQHIVNRPTDPLAPLQHQVQVLFEDPDLDALRLEAVVQAPSGVRHSSAWELREDQSGSGHATIPFPRLTPDSEPGTYEATITVWDRHGHASETVTARLEVNALPAAVLIQSFEPSLAVPGGLLIVHGSGFGKDPATIAAFLADQPLLVRSASPDRLELEIPSQTEGGPLRLITPLGTASSLTDVRVAEMLHLSASSAQVAPGMSVQFSARLHSGSEATGIVWSVDGIPGGNEAIGTLENTGTYTAPASVETPRTVTVRASTIGSSGFPLLAEHELSLIPNPPALNHALVSAASGGTILGTRENLILQVPPKALPGDTSIEIAPLAPATLTAEDESHQVLAAARFTPDGLQFSRPISLTLPITSWMAPGTRLRMLHRSGPEAPWTDEGLEAVVDESGFSATGFILHFSDWLFDIPRTSRPQDNEQPRITRLSPAFLLEGSLQPFLLEGTNFSPNTSIEIVEAANPTRRATGLEIRDRLSIPDRPGQMGLLIRSAPDRSLPANASRALLLRVSNPGSLLRSEAPLELRGLDEYLQTGGTNIIQPDPNSPASRRLFSHISLLGTLRVNARLLDWSATDGIEIFEGSFIDGSGRHGIGASGRQGGLGGLGSGGTGGSGGMGPPRGQANSRYPRILRSHRMLGASTDTSESVPTWSGQHGDLPIVHSGPQGTVSPQAHVRPRYGFGGSPGWFRSGSGYPWGTDHYGSPANIYSAYLRELPDASDYDPGDAEYFEDLFEANEEFMTTHPDGRRGSAAITDDWLRRRLQPNRSAQVESHEARASSPGHGGGGGGASGANSTQDGLGGGAGGEGGSAIRLVSAQSIYLSGGARITTTGGNGGGGARRSNSPVSGGGGGPGSGGSIHLLAGRLFTLNPPSHPSRWQLNHGNYGNGGFLALHINATRQIPSPWERPARPSTASQPILGEYAPHPPPPPVFSGPELVETRRTRQPLVTQIRPFTTLELEGSTSIASPLLELRHRHPNRPERLLPIRDAGSPNDNRRYRIRVLLEPGFNEIELGPPGLDPILVRQILVIPGPDNDGDGLTDADERTFGLNPVNPDSDGDGTLDAEEWSRGTGGNDPDAGYAEGGVFGNGIDLDGDGWSDAHEIAIGTLPNDPTSVPRLSTFVARPNTRVLRPGYEATGSGNSSLGAVVARPHGVRVLRPGIEPGDGSSGIVIAQPARIRTEPQ